MFADVRANRRTTPLGVVRLCSPSRSLGEPGVAIPNPHTVCGQKVFISSLERHLPRARLSRRGDAVLVGTLAPVIDKNNFYTAWNVIRRRRRRSRFLDCLLEGA